MNRRMLFTLATAMIAAAAIGNVSSASPPPPINTTAEVSKLQLTSGPMTGAFVIAPYGYCNWYFANVGLVPFVKALPAQTKSYMNLYLQRIDPVHWNIKDVLLTYNGNPQSATIAGTQVADSDDAYAGTFLSLASAYDAATNDKAWWNANVAVLKNIAYCNIALSMKSTGLVRVYQNPNFTTGYCEDNAQAYRGMRDFANRLLAHADPDAAYYSLVATSIGNGIGTLYSTKQQAFLVADINVSVGTAFYPDAVTQVFPQVYGVTSNVVGVNQYNAAWNYLNKVAPSWPSCNLDPYPWMMLGYCAALRGDAADKANAMKQLTTVQGIFHTNRPAVIISELGYYKLTADLLGVAN